MFIEHARTNSGWIEVISGCMFSGKTEELIRRLNRAIIAKQKVEIFKPSIDTRYHLEKIVSHNDRSISCNSIQNVTEILSLSKDDRVIGIDEAQFFGKEIVEVSTELASKGVRVIIAGLDMDFEGKPFGFMAQLMTIAEFVTKVHAICAICGNLASFSFRLSKSREKVLIGEKESYEARCRKCFAEGLNKV